MKKTIIVLGILGLVLLYLAGNQFLSSANRSSDANQPVLIANTSIEGFQFALPPAEIRFPEDFGPHPEFQTEWWYYTGNLTSENGSHFGYQLTIFRRALLPEDNLIDRASNWSSNQVYLGHFAISNVESREHVEFERFARGGNGLAGAQASPYEVWVEDWTIIEIEPATYKVVAEQDGYAIDLILTDQKGPVLQGRNGYSQKGSNPGNASYYYSQTRLSTRGKIQILEEEYSVEGFSWKDHEYSTSALSTDQIGWDWFALQLNNNAEFKVFNIRKEDGSRDEFSSGSYVDAQGNIFPLSKNDFEIIPTGSWTSPHSGAKYPSGWKIIIPKYELTLTVEPYFRDQELNISYSYWEGAIQISGEMAGQRVTGSGYAELTGYAQSMAGQF